MKREIYIAALAALLFAGSATAKCADHPAPCEISDGSYHIALPKMPESKIPVVVFLHGYGGSGRATIGNKSITGQIVERGYAVIAPNGLRRGEDGPTSWNFHPERTQGRDEADFLQNVVQDAVARFSIDPTQILLAGFSLGGSMTTYLACNQPEGFRAFAPVSGSFWRPHPTECSQPVQLLHTHGWRDGTVPLEGRILSENFAQGDVFYAMNLLRETNLCRQPRAREFSETGPFWRRKWTECSPESALELALFPGGHQVPKEWVPMILDWFEQLPKP